MRKWAPETSHLLVPQLRSGRELSEWWPGAQHEQTKQEEQPLGVGNPLRQIGRNEGGQREAPSRLPLMFKVLSKLQKKRTGLSNSGKEHKQIHTSSDALVNIRSPSFNSKRPSSNRHLHYTRNCKKELGEHRCLQIKMYTVLGTLLI